MSQEKSRTPDPRSRNFATVVYPESAPENWQEILSRHCVPAFISPLHDKDVNPTGEPKKAHYHVILMFEGKKSIKQVQEIFSTIGGVGVEQVKSLRGYARYLCHLDNPEKAQYDTADVKSIASDYIGTIGLAIDKYKAVKEICNWCKEYNVDSYSDLLDYAMNERLDWFRVLCDSGTMVVKEYLKSRSWKERQLASQEQE